jgi:hypothetical protein
MLCQKHQTASKRLPTKPTRRNFGLDASPSADPKLPVLDIPEELRFNDDDDHAGRISPAAGLRKVSIEYFSSS